MDDPTVIIKNFEEILKKNCKKEPLALYKDQKSKIIPNFQGQCSHSVQDVISKVLKQIKAIHKADVFNTPRQDRMKLNKYKKSSFLAVNMLPREEEVPSKTSETKFETQLVTDTQLIHLIDNAEALVDNGITQEFDSIFSQRDIVKIEQEENTVGNDRDSENNEIIQIDNLHTGFSPHNKENKMNPETENVVIETVKNNEFSTCHYKDIIQEYTQLNENCTEMLSKCIEIETKLGVHEEVEVDDEEIQASLVFEAKKSRTPSPLVFDLDMFEKFEKIAVPIVEENTDFKSAKQVINSQRIGKELFIQTNISPEVSLSKEQMSPVLKISAERLKITKTEYTNLTDHVIKEHIPVKVTESDSIFLKDEILFSSDEEFEYLHKEFQDIPLTCALETSFYEQPDMLDKTMYVGFQTASNRSIQISTESFSKAKSLLSDVEKVSLTDLVENLSAKHDTSNTAKSKEIDSDNFVENEIDRLKRPDKRKFEGFITASRKKIKLSDMALARCKKVFQDIDSDDSCSIDSDIDLNHLISGNTIKDNNVHYCFGNSKQHSIDTKFETNPQIDDDILEEFANDMSLVTNEGIDFNTASNKDIPKADVHRHPDKRFFDVIDFSDSILENIENDVRTKKKSSSQTNDIKSIIALNSKCVSNPEFIGFKTASNNQIKISSKAFEKAKILFKDIQPEENESSLHTDEIHDVTSSDFYNNYLNEPSTSKQLGGFKTAINKDIPVSNEALIKSKSILHDIISNVCEDKTIDKFTNFKKEQTAVTSVIGKEKNESSENVYMTSTNEVPNDNIVSKKKTSKKQSEFGFEQVEEFDDDLNEVFNSELLDIEKEHITESCTLKTASKKPAIISEKALAHNNNEFEDLDDDVNLSRDRRKCVDIVPAILKNSTAELNCINIETLRTDNISTNNKSSENTTTNYVTNSLLSGNLQNDVYSKEFIRGFQTASRKPINISKEALAKSKCIFKDIDNENVETILNENENDNVTKQVLQFKGFYTASDKPIEISANALAKSTAFFKDIDNNDAYNIKDRNFDSIQKSKNSQISNIKSVQISAHASMTSKDTFKDFVGDGKTDIPSDLIKFAGFQTASNKRIEISAKALASSKALFKEINDQENKIVKGVITEKDDNLPLFKGFQTAGNKTVKISSEALARSKALFRDIEQDLHIKEEKEKPTFVGFKTASKKPVQISADALAKSKALFKDIDNDLDNVEEHNLKKPKSDLEFQGFKTASKKPIQVSAKALAKSKELFKDIHERDFEKESLTTNLESTKYIAFETTNKNPVQISKEALAKSKTLFNHDVDVAEVDRKESIVNEVVVPKFKGFETASRKPVQISEKALAKSKALFKEVDSKIDSDTYHTNSSQFVVFQTANNNTVKVSEESLARSKRIFEDIDNFKENDVTGKTFNQFKGFETASRKKVNISEEALKKSRQIFLDVNLIEDCKENLQDTNHLTIKNDVALKMANNKEVKVSKNASKDSKTLLTDLGKPKSIMDNSKAISRVCKEDNNLEKLIDTQVLNIFDQTLYTEDFCKESPKQSKRSGSPILSCPRAKKRKFNTPYRSDGKSPIINSTTTPKPDDMLLFCGDYKKTKRYTLKDLAKVEEGKDKLNPDPYILNFDVDNILNFEFTGQRNEFANERWSLIDLKEYFLKVANKKLVPIGWLDIQLKLILWKLISYEVKFPQTLSRVCTVKNVIEQLKYRYDKELYNVERPVLRKILEKDDVPSKTMVLCVAGIFVDGVKVSSVTNASSNVELLLTDGWYCVKAVIDKMLTKLVYDEKITVGCKIVTNGAELMNCEQGVAPWEDTSSSVRLKIFGNSTRRARWDARLGCHGNAAILTKLSSVRPEGGKVSKMRLFVTRVYPMLYVEKFEDGSTVTRSERLENIHQIKYETDRQTVMEKLYEEVEKELSDQDSQDSEGSQLKNRNYSASMITESQTKCIEEKSNRKREKLLQNIQERVRKKIEEKGLTVARNVVALLKIRVAGIEEGDSGVVVTKGFMSIWKPNDILTEIIKEDTWIEVVNVVPTAIRYSEIHLSAGRQTIFNKCKCKENDKIKPYLKALARKYIPVEDLAQNPTMATDYNEIDTVGFIFHVDEESIKQPFQNIYLSDGKSNIICVNFWGGLRKFGFNNVLDTGQIISCTNLQKRAGNTRKSIPQFRVTEFTFFTKTPKSLTARNMIIEIENIIRNLDKKKYCEECIKLKNNYSNKCFTETVSPYRFNEVNLTKNKMFIDSPLVTKREDSLNLTGLDFESTFRQTDTQELSPKSKERKKKVNEKIARLKMIGEPPPLGPMNIVNKSKNAFNSYKSPLAQTSVASAKKTTVVSRNDNQSSPIIQMNRTYVKNINPVKLNFSNAQENSLNEEVDHFAEEFDGSPPLSLE